MGKDKRKSKLQLAQEKAEAAIKETNRKIDTLGGHTKNLYDALNDIQNQFDLIRNIPSDKKLEYEELKNVRLNWKQQAEKIEEEYQKAAAKDVGAGAAGAAAGVAVVTMGPTAAMGIATTFGVASTGTAISSLSGAAATNAALAWLGGGALSAGGGGMAAGHAFLALAGPVGWAIAGVALVGSGLLFWKSMSEKKKLENIFTHISNRDVKSYELAIVELGERITKVQNETAMLKDAIVQIKTFGLDYSQMTEDQQYTLGSYVNLMSASTQLLVNPILGLQPKYDRKKVDEFFKNHPETIGNEFSDKQRDLVLSLANLLYKIELDESELKLLHKSFKHNKKFLKSMEMDKKAVTLDLFKECQKLLFANKI